MFFLALLSIIAAPEVYEWPLSLPPELTSSFAEYRTGRFHAGIDVRTNGIGRDVHAAADGYVSRVRCSPWGYGKAIYLQLNDGNSIVYAHLNDYCKPLRTYVQAAQHAKEDYTVDLYPKPGQFPVTRGEVIAQSGQTGIGAPHLHYEIRDTAQQPIDPRQLGISWPDKTRPKIHSLLIEPKTGEATVNQDMQPYVLNVTHQGNGHYTCAPVHAYGPIAIGVDVIDPGKGGSKLGIYRMRLLRGEEELFRVQHDTLSYDNHRNSVVAYHPFLAKKGRFLLLRRWPGNVCASYAHSSGAGWVTISKAETLTVEITDFSDNTAHIEIPLLPDSAAPEPAGATNTATGDITWEGFGEGLLIYAKFPHAESEAPTLNVAHADKHDTLPFLRVSDTRFCAAICPTHTGMYRLDVHHPRLQPFQREFFAALRGEGDAKATFEGVQLHAQNQSPYGVFIAHIMTLPDSVFAPMKKIGKFYRIWPEATPIDAPVTLSFPAPSDLAHPERVHVYRQQGKHWSRQDTKRQPGHFSIQTRTMGTFTLLEDTTAPIISDITPPDNYHAQTNRPHIHATIADALSGVSDFSLTCDGKWLLASYDPEHARMEWERDETLPAGKHQVVFTITDMAGNTTQKTRTLFIP